MGEYADSLSKSKAAAAAAKAAETARETRRSLPKKSSPVKAPFTPPPPTPKPDPKPHTGEKKKPPTSSSTANNTPDIGQDKVVIKLPDPPKPPKGVMAGSYGAVKTPSKDTLNISSLIPQESAERITKLLFEELSAIELSIIERHDTIDGIRQQYAIISNLSDVRNRVKANRTLSNFERGSAFSIYQIDLDSKIPNSNYLTKNGLTEEYGYLDENNVSVSIEKGFLYIDTNGDLIIELDNMYSGEQVQVQIDAGGTIYEVNN